MAKATYYNENLQPKVFEILSENKDGTLNIGTGRTLVVGKVVVAKDPTIGCVTLGEPLEKSGAEAGAEKPSPESAEKSKSNKQ